MADELNNITAINNTNKQTPIELSYQTIKEFLISKQCRCKYSELFDVFRDLLVDSASGNLPYLFNCLFIFRPKAYMLMFEGLLILNLNFIIIFLIDEKFHSILSQIANKKIVS
jgi:hypothetical protein